MQIRSLSGDQPHSDYRGWSNFLKTVCDVRGTCKGVTYYGSTNCNYIVFPDGTLIQNFGYHGEALMRRIEAEGADAVLADTKKGHGELKRLLAMTTLDRKDFWELEVSFWPKAVEAGVRPFPAMMFQFPMNEWPPGAYIPHTFYFQHPPTRQNFLLVVGALPWASHAWGDTLLPIVEKNPWPMVCTWAEKAAHSDLHDPHDRPIGRLSVHRMDLVCNTQYAVPFCGVDEREAAIRGMRGPARDEAKSLLMSSPIQNRIREKLANTCDADSAVVREMRAILREKGLLRTKTKLTPIDSPASQPVAAVA